jgi:3-hydroxyisobutyrate dehydrogenase-like beta-hydroxyacid dehydrogenase
MGGRKFYTADLRCAARVPPIAAVDWTPADTIESVRRSDQSQPDSGCHSARGHMNATTDAKPRIGFIGLGLMGHGMAKNIVTKGYPLTVRVHRNRKPLEDILAAGASEVATNADVAKHADIVFLCVTGTPQVEAVVHGGDGLLAAARPGQIVVDTSTAEPASTAALRQLFAAKGTEFVDAPLARTPKEAEEGRLNIMVGATDLVFEKLQPVLSAFCENVIHAGPPGHGHTLKLINNFLAMAIATATAEAVATAAKAGVSLQKLHDVISAGGVNSGIFQMMVGRMLHHGDLAGLKFTLANAMKDLRYYTHLAEALPTSAILGEAVHQTMVQANLLGFGDKYIASLMEAQEKLAGVSIVRR